MLWASDPQSNRVAATPGARAACPGCGAEVVAKCGEIVAWHWSHLSTADCDPWYEPESQWHINWKNRFPAEWQEVIVGGHRADIRLPSGKIIEFQNSAISPEEVRQREAAYGNMIWVFNAAGFRQNLSLRDRGNFTSFRWYWPHKSIWSVARPTYFDLGDERLLCIRKIHNKTPCGGWGLIQSLPSAVEAWKRGPSREAIVRAMAKLAGGRKK